MGERQVERDVPAHRQAADAGRLEPEVLEERAQVLGNPNFDFTDSAEGNPDL
jgi:hypothetical protein